MGRAIEILTELSAEELRVLARKEEDRRAAMRMLAIANELDGYERAEAAQLAGMSDQALRDAIKRLNAEGLSGLHDRRRSGRPRRLTAEQEAEVKAAVLAGPDIESDDLALLVAGAGADGDDFAFGRLFLGCIGNDDATGCLFVGLYASDNQAVMQGTESHLRTSNR